MIHQREKENTRSSEGLSDLDFVTGPLDFGQLDPEQFEHLVFHLLDEMGYQELVWRKGGPGNCANDGGRDLEATFSSGGLVPGRRQRWWFEVKFRSRRLDKAVVQSTLLNASAERDLSSLAVITNATVSNECLNWVRKFSERERIDVEICQGHDLEKLLRAHPRTMLRFFREALSFSGQCKAIAVRLAYQFLLPGPEELHLLYEGRADISDPRIIAAACMAESAHGDPAARRWGVALSEIQLSGALSWVLHNLHELAVVANLRGHSHRPLAAGVAYMLSSLISRGLVDTAKEVLRAPERLVAGSPTAPGRSWREYRTSFAMRSLLRETANPCSIMCSKLDTGTDIPDAQLYFSRFCPEDIEPGKRGLITEWPKNPCSIGVVEDEEFCPLGRAFGDESFDDGHVDDLLSFSERLLVRRIELSCSNQDGGDQ